MVCGSMFFMGFQDGDISIEWVKYTLDAYTNINVSIRNIIGCARNRKNLIRSDPLVKISGIALGGGLSLLYRLFYILIREERIW